MRWPVLLSIALTACGQATAPPAAHDFGVAVAVPARVGVAAITVTAPEWLKTQHIHYRLLYQAPTELRAYAYQRWLAPPPELLQQRLMADGLPKALPVHVELMEFEQQFSAPDAAVARMRVLVRVHGGGGHQVLAARQFAFKAPCPSPDAAGAVAALAEVARQASAAIAEWLAGLPGQL